MKTFRCGDVVPGCGRAFTGSEGDIFAQVTVHAHDDHGLLHLPDGFEDQVRAAMTTVAA